MKLFLITILLALSHAQLDPNEGQGEGPPTPTYIDFTCHPKYIQGNDDEYRTMCSEEAMKENYDFAERSKCPKSCLLHQWHVINSAKTDEKTITIGLGKSEEIYFILGKNKELAESYQKQIQEKCQKDMDQINEKQSHCSEWNSLYSCIENIMTCK